MLRWVASHDLSLRNAILALLATGLLCWIFVIQLFNAPIADDFSWLHWERTLGAPEFFTWFLTGLTGRYSNAAVMAVSIGLFGDAAIRLTPMLLTLCFAVASVFLAVRLVRAARPESSRSAVWGAGTALGVLVPATTLVTLPSIYDSVVWYNSVCIFLASLACLTWLVHLWIGAVLKPQSEVRWRSLILIAAVTLITQGFAESTGAIVVGVAAIALAAVPFSAYWRLRWRTNATVLAAGLAGLAVVAVLPGTRARVSIQSDIMPDIGPGTIVRGTLHTLLLPVELASSWRLLLVAALALGIVAAFGPVLRSHPIASLSVGVLAILIPVGGTGFVTYLTVQAEPYRTQTVSLVLAVLGMAAILATLLVWIGSRVAMPSTVKVVATVIIAAAAFGAASPALSSVVQAVALRDALVDYRAASVASQDESGAQVIAVDPAPLLLQTSDTVEFSYNDVDIVWFSNAFKQYYGIEDRELFRNKQETTTYCLPADHSAFPNGASLPQFFGAKNCSELAVRR